MRKLRYSILFFFVVVVVYFEPNCTPSGNKMVNGVQVVASERQRVKGRHGPTDNKGCANRSNQPLSWYSMLAVI